MDEQNNFNPNNEQDFISQELQNEAQLDGNPENGAAPFDPYQQPTPEQNPYQQPNYGQPPYQQPPYPNSGFNNAPQPDLEKRAGTVMTLGIVGLVISIVIGFCCCTLPGPIIGIVGLVKANGLMPMISNLSEKGQKDLKTGRTLCILAIVFGAISMVLGAIMGGLTSLENFSNFSDYKETPWD